MKKVIALAMAAVICVGVLLSGCTPMYDKSPDQYSKIRWITYDYSFKILPSDGCKGTYKFNDKTYNIKAEFESSRVKVVDTDNKNTELFNGDWTYEKNSDGAEQLYIYNISFNTKAYKELDTDYAEHVTLKQEML